jgi:Glycosyl hydrolase family 10
MGTMTFLLPDGLSADLARELERSCLAGGPDSMPWPTQAHVAGNRLTLRRDVDESGCLVAPWDFPGVGRVMGTTATLIERETPYPLLTELARGKVNQLRSQAWEWRTGGLPTTPALEEQIREAGIGFSRTLTQPNIEHGSKQAAATLTKAYQAAEYLVRLYMDQVFLVRHQHQPRLDLALGCRVGSAVLRPEVSDLLGPLCNSVGLPFSWAQIEPTEGNYQWDLGDTLLEWATEMEVPVTAGPLLDFSAPQLPDWLWLWERDLGSIAKFMCDYVAATVKRYRQRIRRWQLTAASNSASVLSLGEDELMWLTVRLAEVAKQIDPGLELIVGIAQPWGEYLALEDRIHSPFVFADTLVRTGLNLAALDLEFVMGVTPRGSYCRDLLEASRLFDLYGILGVPLRVTLGYPSATGVDPNADPDVRVAAGHWRDGADPEAQADWAGSFASLALCKQWVQAVHWAHVSDAEPHQFPHCGLLDADNRPKPVLHRLRELRQKHLR